MSESEKIAILETNQGTVELKLMPDVAPMACENFQKLISQEYYDGVIFHRVIPKFMVQCGDPTGTGSGGESAFGQTFKDEVDSGVKFSKKGLLAMANSGPNTNASQFFITTAVTPWLNMKHTIFGEVTQGYEVIEAIEKTPCDGANCPQKKQLILKAFMKNGKKS